MDNENIVKGIANVLSGIWCASCIHKDVCKKIGKTHCEDLLQINPSEYSSIYNLFDPVLEWLNIHYPSEDVFFVVKRTGAHMNLQHGPVIGNKELRNIEKQALQNMAKESENSENEDN